MNIPNCSFRSLISFMCLLRFADNDCDCQSAIEPEQHFLNRGAYLCDMPVFEDNYSVHYIRCLLKAMFASSLFFCMFSSLNEHRIRLLYLLDIALDPY